MKQNSKKVSTLSIGIIVTIRRKNVLQILESPIFVVVAVECLQSLVHFETSSILL